MSSSKSAKSHRHRLQPYDKKTRRLTKISSPTSPQVSLSDAGDETAFPLYRDNVKERYPEFIPRSRFDVFALATNQDIEGNPNNEEIIEWIDTFLSRSIKSVGFDEAQQLANVMRTSEEVFSMPADEVSGVKPRQGDRYVSIRPIPQSNLSLRLWPGCVSRREFCLDFVDSDTKEPVNMPLDFELYNLGSSSQLGMPTHKLHSLEAIFFPGKPLMPGKERFFLVERQTILLRRKNKEDVKFSIPVHPKSPPPPPEESVDFIEFSFS